MTNQQIMENIFKKYGIVWHVKEFKEYVNPKPKSVNSIISKMQRLYNKAKNKKEFHFANSGINDLLRITIITEYENVVPLIKKIKEVFKDTTGSFKVKNSGYYGIHLHFYLDGVPCEIQLAPELLVMAIDCLHTYYERWRDFNYDDEFLSLEEKKKEILKEVNEEKRNLLIENWLDEKEAWNKKIAQKERDLKLRQKIYREVYEIIKFDDFSKNIKKVFDKINGVQIESTPMNDEKLINCFHKSLLTNGLLDKDKVKNVAEELIPLLCPMQEKLIEIVKEKVMKDNSLNH